MNKLNLTPNTINELSGQRIVDVKSEIGGLTWLVLECGNHIFLDDLEIENLNTCLDSYAVNLDTPMLNGTCNVIEYNEIN
jgi:hypothetical protein